MVTLESGWAVAWDQPSFAEARHELEANARHGSLEFLHPTLAQAYRNAARWVDDKDTHKARVFWVVRSR